MSDSRVVSVSDMRIALLGAGGQARETAEYAQKRGYQVEFWSAHEKYRPSNSDINFVPIEELLLGGYDVPFLCSLGAPGVKRELTNAFPEANYRSLFAEHTYVANDATIGDGVTVAPQAAITSGVKIGSHVLINTGATISHDTTIGNYATVGPGVHIGGHVNIGEGAIIGIGAVIKHGVTIGAHSYIGAGATVIDDIPSQSVAYGVPAIVKRTSEGWLYEL